MPSPFPGMDPYIEMQDWESFHAAFIVDLGDALSPLVQPKYIARPQRRVYVEHTFESEDGVIIADTAVLLPSDPSVEEATMTSTAAVATAEEAVEVVLPMPETRYENYLTVRDVETMEVVTIIELLSPANKRRGEGRRQYLAKREEVLTSATNLVELDLLREGSRLPTVSRLPSNDYYAFVSRAGRRPRAHVYAWSIRDPLPKIPIPLRREDPDVSLDLQSVFTARYDRGAFSRSLNYSRPVHPPLNEKEAKWAAELIASC